MLASLIVTKSSVVAQFLQARARWRLDSAGASASHAARSVVSLLDAAAYLRDVPDDDPDIVTLDAAGCFRGEAFDPGPEGALLIRRWQLADVASAGPRDLLTALAQAALKTAPTAGPAPIPGPALRAGPVPPTKRAPSRR